MNLPPFRTWILAVVSTLLLLTICYFLLERWGLLIGLSISLFWNYGMLLHIHKNSIEYFGGKIIQGQDPWRLNETLRSYEEKLRCPTIKVYTCDSTEPLCLISISQWNKPYLIISESLLNLLSSQEKDSFLALCVSSIKNRNTFLIYSLDRVALTWISFSHFWNQILQPLNQLNLPKHLCFFIAWIHWKLAYTKKLQARSDLETYKMLSGNRSLATALWKIHGALHTRKNPVPKVFRYQSIIGNAASRRTALQFVLPIEHRLQLLIGYFPI